MLDRLTLDQLRILIAVAETGSFSAAARKLGRVQSAVSQSVQTLEDVLQVPLFAREGKTPVLTEAGRALLDDARNLVKGADTLRARAESIAADVEPELTLAADQVFPSNVLMRSLQRLTVEFPCLPVTLFTEGMGGPEQRLRDGSVKLAIYAMLPTGTDADLDAQVLTHVPMIPVAAAGHPLAALTGPLTREMLEPHVQLVLTDRTPLTSHLRGGIFSLRIWRFADMGARLEYLLGGFGWCFMPEPLVAPHLAAGRLVRLTLLPKVTGDFAVSVVHLRGRAPGRAGRWLIDDLRRHLEAGSGSETSKK